MHRRAALLFVSLGAITALVVAVALAAFATACNTIGDIQPPDSGVDDDASVRMFGGKRPVPVHVPAGYDPSKPAPLVMMLHGYSSSSTITEWYFPMSTLADVDGFFYVAPNGTVDRYGARFWNATDACCDVEGVGVDDVAYLAALVAEIQGAYAIDPKRIYVMGHSNGGFMAHRLACDRPDVFAAIVSYAGAVWADPSKCKPSAPIGILQVHGTADDSTIYGGTIVAGDAGDAGKAGDAGDAGAEPPYPGAKQTVAFWAGANGCAPDLVDTGMPLHVDADGIGKETTVLRHAACTSNGAAELWSVDQASHVFSFSREGLDACWQFLKAHAKP